MGSCLSTALRCVFGTPEGYIQLPTDENNNIHYPEEGNVYYSEDESNVHRPEDEGNVNHPGDEGNVCLSESEENLRLPEDGGNTRPLNDVDNKTEDSAAKRRALLVGIAYSSPGNTWSELEGSHGDVDRYRKLLITTYGYRPEDIVMLKDLPKLPKLSHPTRVNMIRELKALVSGAAPGDRFTFFYSGHSDQQDAEEDQGEEDGQDEMIIASDEKTILDNELKEILVNPLPVGCSLLAILDTCHSGTMLDLPHYRCNSVYVPWISKGNRRTKTMYNMNVRRQAMGFSNSVPLPSIEAVIEGQQPAVQSLPLDTQLDEGRPADQLELSPRGRPRGTRQQREPMLFTNQIRYTSPEARFACNGWCKYSEDLHPNVLSLSACSDLQRAWEGPNGSLTTVLCNYLEKHSCPPYKALMTHINFQLHDNALALHKYTRQRKTAHNGQKDDFDGELDNFQEPELSSLEKLNMDGTLQL